MRSNMLTSPPSEFCRFGVEGFPASPAQLKIRDSSPTQLKRLDMPSKPFLGAAGDWEGRTGVEGAFTTDTGAETEEG